MINVYVLDSLSWYRMLLFISIAFLTSLPKINTTPDFVFSLTCKTFNERICLFLDFYLPWQKIIVFESLSGKFKKNETTTICKTMICIRWYILVEIRTERKALLKHQLEWELWKKAYKSPHGMWYHTCMWYSYISGISSFISGVSCIHIWYIIVHIRLSLYMYGLSSFMYGLSSFIYGLSSFMYGLFERCYCYCYCYSSNDDSRSINDDNNSISDDMPN